HLAHHPPVLRLAQPALLSLGGQPLVDEVHVIHGEASPFSSTGDVASAPPSIAGLPRIGAFRSHRAAASSPSHRPPFDNPGKQKPGSSGSIRAATDRDGGASHDVPQGQPDRRPNNGNESDVTAPHHCSLLPTDTQPGDQRPRETKPS